MCVLQRNGSAASDLVGELVSKQYSTVGLLSCPVLSSLLPLIECAGTIVIVLLMLPVFVILLNAGAIVLPLGDADDVYWAFFC